MKARHSFTIYFGDREVNVEGQFEDHCFEVYQITDVLTGETYEPTPTEEVAIHEKAAEERCEFDFEEYQNDYWNDR